MLLHLPFVVFALLAFLSGLGLEMTAYVLNLELPALVQSLGLTTNYLRVGFYIAAILGSALGIAVLRIFPRIYAPHDVMGLDRTASMVTEGSSAPRIPHANDPLQSVYVAVIMISAVLLIGIVS